jgi:penicillin-binding protein 2
MEVATPGNTTIYPPRLRGELGVNPVNLQIIKEAMLADVEDGDGTGRRAGVSGWRIGGKTGTAEIKKGNRVVDKTTWFVSFAPYEKPQYVVVVMIESGASGGHTCAPVAGQIYRVILGRPRGAGAPALAMISP